MCAVARQSGTTCCEGQGGYFVVLRRPHDPLPSLEGIHDEAILVPHSKYISLHYVPSRQTEELPEIQTVETLVQFSIFPQHAFRSICVLLHPGTDSWRRSATFDVSERQTWNRVKPRPRQDVMSRLALDHRNIFLVP